jgi:hypothetical protein
MHMSNVNETPDASQAGAGGQVDPAEHGGHDGPDQDKQAHEVAVKCDYISADDPIHRKFPPATLLAAVKQWAREEFVPNPPSDKAYYLNDDKSRHRFTAEEEQKTLAQLGYRQSAHFRLNEEQASGA